MLAKRKGPEGWIADRRGAAAVEAVVMLPVFILILFGVLYVEKVWENRQVALLIARSCAWQHSNAGCQRPPQGCERVVGAATDTGIDNEIRQEAEETSPLDAVSQVPLIGSALEGIFGSAVSADARRTVERPPLLGGRVIEVRGRYYLMCNEKERTLGGILREAFCGVAVSFPGVCGKP